MARFNMAEADNYGSGNSGSFFSLKNDKDTARVRFLYNTIEDVEGYAVHQIDTSDGKHRYVNCLRAYNEPLEKCPFCAAQMRVVPKLFLKLYNEDAGECQIWERGKSYFERISSLSSRYNPLVDEIVEIERNGKAGDKQTSYTFYPVENVPTDINQYDCKDPLGTIIMDKTADEMNEYLVNGAFPSDGEQVSQARTASRENLDYPTGRRTPSQPTTGRRAF